MRLRQPEKTRTRTDPARNFANLAPWVDVLFGTHQAPHHEDYELGVPGLALPPRRPLCAYLALLCLPLWPRAADLAAPKATVYGSAADSPAAPPP